MADGASKTRERTFIMVKPDGVARGLTWEIFARFNRKGYKCVALRMMSPSKEHMEKHYEDLKGKSFFDGLVGFFVSGAPVVASVWEGDGVVKGGRVLLGATKPSESAPGTIRGDFCIDIGRNACHGSDSVESAEKEIAHWFPEGVASYSLPAESMIYE